MKNFLVLLLASLGAATNAAADENPFAAFVGAYKVVSGDCMKDMVKVSCPATEVRMVLREGTAYLKESSPSGGASYELFLRNQKDFSHWDVAELGGNPPDFAYWRRNLSEQSGHVQTVLRQFTRKEDRFEYSLTFYEKESLNGKRVNLNYKYILVPL